MLIRDLEQQTGLDRATIRYYEKEGLIAPQRKENSYRVYTQEDCENLLKIKLLRQLEMPLQKIKDLQEGRGNFSEALEAQLAFLEEKQQRTNLTKQVCNQIRSAEENYKTLDARYYLKLLDESTQKEDAAPGFSEKIPQERHPWLRYIARMMDYSLVAVLILFIFIVILRIRPVHFPLIIGCVYISFLLSIAVNTFCLHIWGTTPGKYVFGIRVNSVSDDRLSYKDAMWREFNALRLGMGYNIPIYGIWRQYRSYRQYMSEGKLDYDEDHEFIYENFENKKKLPLAALLSLLAILICICAADEERPTHRGELTVKDFCENYNDYVRVYEGTGTEYIREMDIDGTWRAFEFEKIPPNRPVDAERCFEFYPEWGNIQTITYENRWEDPFWFTPLDNERLLVVYTLVASQESISNSELIEFERLYREKMKEEATEGSLTYKNISISWKIYTEYTAFKTGVGIYNSRSNKESSGKTAYVNLKLKIEILDN